MSTFYERTLVTPAIKASFYFTIALPVMENIQQWPGTLTAFNDMYSIT